MNVEFKIWDKKNNRMILDAKGDRAGSFMVDIAMDGSFKIHEIVHAFHGFDTIQRDCRDYELLRSIGLTDNDGKALFPGDVIQDPEGKRLIVCYGQYKSSRDSWNVEPTHFGTFIKFEDETTFALTQEGSGYSISSQECVFIEHINQIQK